MECYSCETCEKIECAMTFSGVIPAIIIVGILIVGLVAGYVLWSRREDAKYSKQINELLDAADKKFSSNCENGPILKVCSEDIASIEDNEVRFRK